MATWSDHKAFYNNCVKATHDLALQHGIIKGGVKLVPELLPLCRALIVSDFDCDELRERYTEGDQLVQIISYRCVMYGIMLAFTWHNIPQGLNNMVAALKKHGPNLLVPSIVEDDLKFTPKRFSDWMEAVFTVCALEFDKIPNPDVGHTYMLLEACYQMGISMMLSHYGL